MDVGLGAGCVSLDCSLQPSSLQQGASTRCGHSDVSLGERRAQRVSSLLQIPGDFQPPDGHSGRPSGHHHLGHPYWAEEERLSL